MAGRGSFIESYPLFGAALDDYDALYDEKIQLLLQIDAGERVTWSGQFRPPLDDAVILPRPYDKPGLGEHLRISVATGGNPAVVGARRHSRAADQLRDHRRPAGPVRPAGRSVPAGASSRPRRPASTRFVVGVRHGLHRRRRQGARPLLPRTGSIRCAGSPASAASRCPTATPTRRRPRPAAPTSSASPSRSPSGSSPCTGVLQHDRQGFQMDLSSVPQKESLRAIELLGTRSRPWSARPRRCQPSPSGPSRRPTSPARPGSGRRACP